MKRPRRTLAIYGMNTYLGREVARFGRALGHRMVGVVDAPPALTDPWMHGIHWATDTDPLKVDWPEAPLAAIVYCDTTLWQGDRRSFRQVLVDRPRQLIDAAQDRTPPPRFILRSTIAQPLLPSAYTRESRRIEEILLATDLASAIFRLPLLYGPDRPDSVAAMLAANAIHKLPFVARAAPPSMRVETAALAMLRACLEPDINGILTPDEIARVGDVMIAQ